MKILIATEPDDIHASIVKLAVEDAGHTCDLWFTADLLARQTETEPVFWGSTIFLDDGRYLQPKKKGHASPL